jgi:hypothetical protein
MTMTNITDSKSSLKTKAPPAWMKEETKEMKNHEGVILKAVESFLLKSSEQRTKQDTLNMEVIDSIRPNYAVRAAFDKIMKRKAGAEYERLIRMQRKQSEVVASLEAQLKVVWQKGEDHYNSAYTNWWGDMAYAIPYRGEIEEDWDLKKKLMVQWYYSWMIGLPDTKFYTDYCYYLDYFRGEVDVEKIGVRRKWKK